ncbi:SIR2 family protein [Vibrio parahaemolyticus]|uniref:SIR2 family protein n=1 Tax=Vibrio parahaemolyticus TaxID=670 RepID=UPI0023621C6F|nr:SIR2 family protein [Vibrio parahaemolyticus]
MIGLKELKLNSCYSVFCGAGISVNSGIPIVVSFQSYLLKALGVSEEHRELILNSGMPFEVFMESINDLSDIAILLSMFNLGTPNHTHRYLAHEISQGRIALILTTNFDCHLENALTEIGLKENQDFRVIHDDFGSMNIDQESIKCPVIVKLHGCFKKTQQLGIVMKAVASRRKREEVQPVINSFMNNASSEKIVFMGYSFSDHFDITPAIEDSFQSDKSILVIEHCNEYRSDFKKANGSLIKYANAYSVHTNTCIEVEECGFARVSYRSDNKWRQIVDDWLSSTVSISKSLPKIIELELLLKSIRYKEAIEIGECMINEFSQRNKWFAQAAGSLGIAYYRQKYFCLAFRMHRKSLSIAKEIKEPRLEHRALSNMANVLYNKNKERWAIPLLNRAVEIAKDVKCDNLLAIAYSNLSMNLSRFDRQKSVMLLRDALDIYIELGDVVNIGRCKINLGIELYFLKDYEEALTLLLEGKDYCYKNGQNSNLIYSLIYLGFISFKNNNISESIAYYRQANDVSDEFGISLIEHRLKELATLLDGYL